MKRRIYKVKFYRINANVEPMMRQETDVVFELPVENSSQDEIDAIIWNEMWKQNPAWLQPHGSSIIGFRGWSSVMCERESMEKVEVVDRDSPDDLTGEGNMVVALTFHPLLPSDLRSYLRKAYERGLRDCSKGDVKDAK